jgi:tRNA modification GTPase
MIEAELDFAEDEDLPATVAGEAFGLISGVRKGVAAALRDDRRGERLREGLEVVILGPPNAGKSSLLNALAQRDVAIVSAEPGTTRDLIEVRLDIEGYPLTLTDTAGIRAAESAVEGEGIRRAEERAAAADIALLLTDATARDRGQSDSLTLPPTVLRVATKLDLVDSEPERLDGFDHAVSVISGVGLDGLISDLGRRAAELTGQVETAIVTRQRHRDVLNACLASLDRPKPGQPLETVAEDLRTAADALGRVTGRIDVEDWLDVIFHEFCIGK